MRLTFSQTPNLFRGDKSMHISRYLVYAALALFAVFLLQNLSIVPVSFLVWTIELPRIVLLILTFMLGYLTASTMRLTRRPAQ
ncbi:MAG: DUF1049 domain-containing protein [Pseudomonadales bacterium]|nr:MAG: DUF1049 domain-containing protein [Pseudomonadales bacterium]